MKELQPINENVLLDVTKEIGEQKTASGIFIPDSAKEKKNVAKVIALSSKIESPEIVMGDMVVYKEYAGTEFEFEGKTFLLLPYAEILSKVVETEAI
ncbi:MAG: co-chaperone GroES [Bacteroidales bacterium]|nr:co-chaperone GroES [Bacteroidales bacterium]